MNRADQPKFSVRLSFHESLRFFLPKNAHDSLDKILREKTSVKDAIESCGVPHPEVDLILIDGSPVDFTFQLRREYEGEILGIPRFSGAFSKWAAANKGNRSLCCRWTSR